MKSYRYFIFILGTVLGASSLSAQLSEGEARAEATFIIQLMHQAIHSWETEFSKVRSDPHSPRWVAAKLKTMVNIDQLIRRVLLENAMRKTWPYSIRRVFVEYFINFDADITYLQTLGFLQLNDYLQYTYLKQLMLDSGALEAAGGWPIISLYGRKVDYYAFIIAQHGQAYDHAWQYGVLIPRLKTLFEMGESSEITHLWLSHPEPHYLDEMARLMEIEGGIWAGTIPEVSRMQHFFLELPALHGLH